MRKLTLCVVLVLGVVFNDVAARSLTDSQSKDNVGIVGGDEVDIKQYPYQAALLYLGGDYCGGSIISEEYILTAAHCVRYISAEKFKIRVGSSYIEGGVIYDVESAVYHPDFNYNTVDYDIAVMKISGKIEINGDTVDIVKLPDAGSELKTGDLVTVSGWGDTTGHGQGTHVLRAVTLPIFDKKHCSEVYQIQLNRTITDRMVCAGFKEPGKSACYGDSGGPMVGQNRVQYGIVSFGAPNCQGYDFPNVYANVANLRTWIQQTTGV